MLVSSTWPPAKLESILAAARLGAGTVSEGSRRRGTARDDNGFATMLTTSRRSDADMDAPICSDGGPGHLRRAGEHRERQHGCVRHAYSKLQSENGGQLCHT